MASRKSLIFFVLAILLSVGISFATPSVIGTNPGSNAFDQDYSPFRAFSWSYDKSSEVSDVYIYFGKAENSMNLLNRKDIISNNDPTNAFELGIDAIKYSFYARDGVRIFEMKSNFRYYWRVDIRDNTGKIITGSTISFTTKSPPPPTCQFNVESIASSPFPANNSLGIKSQITLNWIIRKEETIKDIVFSSDNYVNNMDDIPRNLPNRPDGQWYYVNSGRYPIQYKWVSDNTLELKDLAAYTNYYWRVKSYNCIGSLWSFSTNTFSTTPPSSGNQTNTTLPSNQTNNTTPNNTSNTENILKESLWTEINDASGNIEKKFENNMLTITNSLDPRSHWIYNMNTDKANQLRYKYPIGSGDFSISFDMGWKDDSIGDLMIAQLGIVDKNGKIIAMAGHMDGNADVYGYFYATIADGSASGKVWQSSNKESSGKAAFIIERKDGIIKIYKAGVEIISSGNNEEVSYIAIITSNHMHYNFGTAWFENLTIQNTTTSNNSQNTPPSNSVNYTDSAYTNQAASQINQATIIWHPIKELDSGIILEIGQLLSAVYSGATSTYKIDVYKNNALFYTGTVTGNYPWTTTLKPNITYKKSDVIKFVINSDKNFYITGQDIKHFESSTGNDPYFTIIYTNIISPPVNTNNPPKAVLKIDKIEAYALEDISLDASSSYDPDQGDSVKKYEWKVDNVLFSNSPKLNANFAVGNHIISLTVYDSKDLSSTVSKNITIVQAYIPLEINDARESIGPIKFDYRLNVSSIKLYIIDQNPIGFSVENYSTKDVLITLDNPEERDRNVTIRVNDNDTYILIDGIIPEIRYTELNKTIKSKGFYQFIFRYYPSNKTINSMQKYVYIYDTNRKGILLNKTISFNYNIVNQSTYLDIWWNKFKELVDGKNESYIDIFSKRVLESSLNPDRIDYQINATKKWLAKTYGYTEPYFEAMVLDKISNFLGVKIEYPLSDVTDFFDEIQVLINLAKQGKPNNTTSISSVQPTNLLSQNFTESDDGGKITYTNSVNGLSITGSPSAGQGTRKEWLYDMDYAKVNQLRILQKIPDNATITAKISWNTADGSYGGLILGGIGFVDNSGYLHDFVGIDDDSGTKGSYGSVGAVTRDYIINRGYNGDSWSFAPKEQTDKGSALLKLEKNGNKVKIYINNSLVKEHEIKGNISGLAIASSAHLHFPFGLFKIETLELKDNSITSISNNSAQINTTLIINQSIINLLDRSWKEIGDGKKVVWNKNISRLEITDSLGSFEIGKEFLYDMDYTKINQFQWLGNMPNNVNITADIAWDTPDVNGKGGALEGGIGFIDNSSLFHDFVGFRDGPDLGRFGYLGAVTRDYILKGDYRSEPWTEVGTNNPSTNQQGSATIKLQKNGNHVKLIINNNLIREHDIQGNISGIALGTTNYLDQPFGTFWIKKLELQTDYKSNETGKNNSTTSNISTENILLKETLWAEVDDVSGNIDKVFENGKLTIRNSLDPKSHWIYNINIDKANQLRYNYSIGSNDTNITFSMGWQDDGIGDLMIAQLGIVDKNGKIIAMAGHLDGTSENYGYYYATIADGSASGKVWKPIATEKQVNGKASFSIVRKNGIITIYKDALEIVSNENKEDVMYIAIITSSHMTYNFGTAWFENVAIQNTTSLNTIAICPSLYDPVYGTKNSQAKIYNNRCFAEQDNAVDIASIKSQCK